MAKQDWTATVLLPKDNERQGTYFEGDFEDVERLEKSIALAWKLGARKVIVKNNLCNITTVRYRPESD